MIVYTLEQPFVKRACDRLTEDADFGKKKLADGTQKYFQSELITLQNYRSQAYPTFVGS